MNTENLFLKVNKNNVKTTFNKVQMKVVKRHISSLLKNYLKEQNVHSKSHNIYFADFKQAFSKIFSISMQK